MVFSMVRYLLLSRKAQTCIKMKMHRANREFRARNECRLSRSFTSAILYIPRPPIAREAREFSNKHMNPGLRPNGVRD